MSNERLRLVIEVDAASGRAEIRQVEGDLKRLSSTADHTTDAIRSMEGGFYRLRDALAALGIAASVSEMLRLSDAYRQMAGRLQLVTASAEEAARVQQRLYDLARETRGDWGATVDLYTRLARSTKQLGVSQDQLLTITKAINQAIIVSGASSESAAAALFQLGQALSAGVLRGEEFNSVVEQTPRLAKMIADGLGVSIGQLRQLAMQGKLTADVVIKALLGQAKTVEEEFRKMPQTVGQALTVVGNAFEKWIGEQDKAAGVSQRVAGALLVVADHMDAVARSATAAASALAGLKASSLLAARGLGVLGKAAAGVGAAFAGWEIGQALKREFPAVEQFGITLGALLHKLLIEIKFFGAKMAAELHLVMADPLAAIRERIAEVAHSVAEALRFVGFDDLAAKMDGVSNALHANSQAAKQYRAEIARLNKEREQAIELIDRGAVAMMRESMGYKLAAEAAKKKKNDKDTTGGGGIDLGIGAMVQHYRERARIAHEMTQAMLGDEIDLLLAQQEQRQALLDEQRQKEIERVQQQIQDEQARREAILAINQRYDELETQLALQTTDRIIAIEKRRAEQQLRIERQARDARLSLAAGAMGALSQLLAQGGRRAFEASKALAIAQTVLSTYAAAQKAYESQLAIPTPDAPARAAAAAAIAVAQGMARVMAIQRQHYGGAAAASAAVGGGGAPATPGGMATRAGYGMPQPVGAQQQAAQPVQITLQVQALHPDNLTPETLRQVADALAPVLQDTIARGGQQVQVMAA